MKKFNQLLLALITIVGLFLIAFFPVKAVESKKVVVGWYLNAGLQDGCDNDSLGGYNYEYLCKIAQYANWDLEFVFGTRQELEEKLIAKEIDLLGDMAMTDSRAMLYNYCLYPSTNSRLLLVCKNYDERFYYQDYASFNGMKVATVASTVYQDMFSEIATANNFQVKYYEYANNEAMLEALEAATVDAILISDTTHLENGKIIAKFNSDPHYFVVNKARNDILEKLNEAMSLIESSEPFIKERLYLKYFGNNYDEVSIAFTREEANYINSQNSIKVLISNNKNPLVYTDDANQEKGFIINYLHLIEEKTGLKFTYIMYDNYEEMLEAYQNNEGDICAEIPDDISYGNKFGLLLTKPYLNLTYGIIFYPYQSGGLDTLALENGNTYIGNKLISRGFKVKYYKNNEACLDAVASKDADAAVMNSYVYEQLIYHEKYEGLIFHIDSSLNSSMSFGVSGSSNKNIFTILEKNIGNISDETVSSILVNNTFVKQNYTLADFINMYMPMIIVIILMLIILSLLAYGVSNQKKANKKLKLAKQEIERVNEAKNFFLERMSHDMRTPLSTIIGISKFGILESTDAKTTEYFQQIKVNSEYLLALMNDLLNMGNIESNQIQLVDEVIPIGKIEADILTIVKPHATDKGIELSVTYQNDFNLEYLLIDDLRLKQALINIINNAIKYTKSNGYVKYICNYLKVDNYLQMNIVIKDNGIGMSKEFLKHMYEPFAREENSLSKFENGSGLGLAISKNLIDKMHGKITCESTLQKGTKFTITIKHLLPTNKQIENYKIWHDKRMNINLKRLEKKQVLVCEDVDINAYILIKILDYYNLITTRVNDGNEAIEECKMHNYDIVLMDIRMPNINGYEAVRAIRKFDKKTPIIAISANAYEADKLKSQASGMNDHLEKPIDSIKLLSILLKYIK